MKRGNEDEVGELFTLPEQYFSYLQLISNQNVECISIYNSFIHH